MPTGACGGCAGDGVSLSFATGGPWAGNGTASSLAGWEVLRCGNQGGSAEQLKMGGDGYRCLEQRGRQHRATDCQFGNGAGAIAGDRLER